jgi:hypothetical protein
VLGFERLQLMWRAWGAYDDLADAVKEGKLKTSDIVNLLVSSLLAGLAVGWTSHLAGSDTKASLTAFVGAAIASLVQHIRQSPTA